MSSKKGGVVKTEDTPDLKSGDPRDHTGSNPVAATISRKGPYMRFLTDPSPHPSELTKKPLETLSKPATLVTLESHP